MSQVIPSYYKGGNAYHAIKLRNKDLSYKNLENLDGLVVLFYVDASEKIVVFRKDSPDEEADELAMRKVTSYLYEQCIPPVVTKTMQTGVTWCEIGTLEPAAGLEQFVSICKYKCLDMQEAAMGDYLPPPEPEPEP